MLGKVDGHTERTGLDCGPKPHGKIPPRRRKAGVRDPKPQTSWTRAQAALSSWTRLSQVTFVAETPKAKGTKAKINERAPSHLKSTARHGNRQLGEAAHRWAGRAREAHPA